MTRTTVSSQRTRRGRAFPIVIAVVLVGAVVIGIPPRVKQAKARESELRADTAAPAVFTERVPRDTSANALELPGSIAGLHETGIYARTNGFVKSLRVDIG